METKELFSTTTFVERLRTNAIFLAYLLFGGILLIWAATSSFVEGVVAVIFVALILFIARHLKIVRSQSWLFAYLVLAKLAVVLSLLPHFGLSKPGSITDEAWFWSTVCAGLVALWSLAEGQVQRIRRAFSLTALLIASEITNYWLRPHDFIIDPDPGFDHYWIPEVRTSFLEAGGLADELTGSLKLGLIILPFFGILLFSVLSKANYRTPTQSRLSYRSLLLGSKINLTSFLVGTVAACVVIGFFHADNSYIFTGVRPYYNMEIQGFPWLDMKVTTRTHLIGDIWRTDSQFGQNRLIYHFFQFNIEALSSALNGIRIAAPFILSGCGLAWCVSRYRLTGLLPILAIGALCGLGWHFAYPDHGYWTPYMSTMQSAMLIGMIAASGFGAVAQLFLARLEDDAVVVR
jgi:hypothetical protein